MGFRDSLSVYRIFRRIFSSHLSAKMIVANRDEAPKQDESPATEKAGSCCTPCCKTAIGAVLTGLAACWYAFCFAVDHYGEGNKGRWSALYGMLTFCVGVEDQDCAGGLFLSGILYALLIPGVLLLVLGCLGTEGDPESAAEPVPAKPEVEV